MAKQGEEPPPYGAPPQAPKPAYGGPPFPQDQQQHGYYPPPGQQNYYQPGPQMGYYNQQQQQGPFPAGQGPYPPQGQYGQPGPGQYYPPGPGYAPQQKQRRKPGLMEGLLAGIACCCCLDCLF